jgi:hypothetical protein
MHSKPRYFRGLFHIAAACWLTAGTTLLAAAERTGTGAPAAELEHDDPAARNAFRLLTLKSGNREYNPNDLLKAKAQVKTMAVSASAWPQSRQAALFNGTSETNAANGAILPLTAGIQRSDWTALGPGNIGGRIRSLVINPANPGMMYVGAVGGGVWKTVNGGANWTALNDFMPSIAIGSLVMDPANPDILYAGTGESYPSDGLRGAGIFKTIDAGATWNQLASTANANFHFVNRMAVSPVNSQILLACTQSGVWRSTDGGANWTRTLSEASTDVEWHPADGSKVVVSGSQNGAYWSVDAGVTWVAATGIPAFGRVELALCRSSPNTVYASIYYNNGELYRSTDGGHTWSARNVGNSLIGNQGWYNNALWVDPLDENNLLLGGTGMLRSTDGGLNFTSVWVGDLHSDQHYLVEAADYSAGNRAVYAANDGGIFRTDDFMNLMNGSLWYSLNNDLGVTQFYAGAGNPNNGMYMGGTQDNGTPRYNGTYNGWVDVIGADGGWTAADPVLGADGSSYWYGETQNWSTIRVHLDAGGNVLDNTYFTGSNDAGGLYIPPMILDPNDPQRLYKGGSRLWRLDNARTAAFDAPWAIVRGPGEAISAIAVAPGNSNLIWLGTSNGAVWSTANGLAANPTWTQRGMNVLPFGFCTRVTVDPVANNRVYATYGGFNGNNIWKSEDGGATWTDITSNLPDVPVRSLVVNKWNTNLIYAGTEIGVFASENRGGSWSPGNDGPANASVDELFWVGNRLIAATHGRGMFRITVNTPPAAAITVPANNANFATGSNIAITATAADPDGSIAKVEFFRGATKIGEDLSSPYQATFANAPAGLYALTAKATDNDGGTFTSSVVNITVGISGIILPGRLQAEDYKAGGQGVGYNDLTPTNNQGGQYKPADGVDIESTGDVGGGYNVGWIQAGEWLAYDVYVTTAGTYTFTMRMAADVAGTRTAAVVIDGGAARNFTLTNGSGWQSWKDVTVGGIALTAGAHSLRINMLTNSFNINYLNVAAANAAPIANAGADRTVSANTLVTLDGRASSDPDNGPQPLSYAWTQISGSSVTLANANTAQPTFTPSAAGSYAFRLAVSDGAASAPDTVRITVSSPVFTITASAGANGSISPAGAVAVNQGANQTFTMTPAAGYVMNAVTVDGVSQGAITSYTFSNVTANHTIAATFKAAPVTFTLATSAVNGSIALSPSGGTYVSGTVVTLTASPSAGFAFSNWSGDATGAANPTTVTMNSNKSVSANFTALPSYTVTASAGANGTISPSGTVTTNGGTARTFTMAANAGFTINAVTVDGVSQGAIATYTFPGTTSGSHTISVTFKANPGIALPGRLQAEDFKAGGQGVGYNDLTPSDNQGGQYRPTEGVDIESTGDVGGGYNVGWTQAGEWLAYDVNVAAAGPYNFTMRLASAIAGTKTVAVSVDGNTVATFNFTDASGWQTYNNYLVSGVNLTAGAHVLRITMNTGSLNVNYLDVAAAPLPELLVNGNFGNALASWNTSTSGGATAAFTNDAGAAKIAITAAGTNPWDIQIYQQVAMTAGKLYTLEFDMKSEATPKNFKVVVEHNGDPWTKFHEQQYTVTSAANSYQHYKITWTPAASDATVKIGFHFGVTNLNDCWLDNVSLK